MPIVPIDQSRAVLLAPQVLRAANARSLDVKSEVRLAQHVDHVDAQPTRAGIQMVGHRLDVPSCGIGESPCNQARGVTAILLLNQAALQSVVV